jgi:hypothetical protein
MAGRAVSRTGRRAALRRSGVIASLILLLGLLLVPAASASGVSGVTASANPSLPGAAASYTITYTPATGQTFGNTITVKAAPGTTFNGCSSCSGYYELVQGSTQQSIASISAKVAAGSSTANEFVITLGLDLIWGGQPVTIVAPGTNPATGATETLSVWTSADATPGTASYPVGTPAAGLLQGAYPNQSNNSPAYLQSLFGTPTHTAPTLGSEYLPGGSWTAIDGAGTLGPTGSSSLAYLQSNEDWSTPAFRPTPGYQPIFAVQIIPTQSSQCTPACNLPDGAHGNYNQYFHQLAQTLVNLGLGRAWLRLGWEFDNVGAPYTAWGIGTSTSQATAFAGYWRQIVNTMRSVPGANFKFVWNPLSLGFLGASDPEYPNSGGPDLADAWPGPGYVDYIGLDLYDQMGWGTAPDTWSNYIQPQLTAALSFAAPRNTPLAFPEWGVCSPQAQGTADQDCQGDDPAYINQMHAFMINQANNVAWENYFNISEALHNSQITGGSFPKSLAAFQADFG